MVGQEEVRSPVQIRVKDKSCREQVPPKKAAIFGGTGHLPIHELSSLVFASLKLNCALTPFFLPLAALLVVPRTQPWPAALLGVAVFPILIGIGGAFAIFRDSPAFHLWGSQQTGEHDGSADDNDYMRPSFCSGYSEQAIFRPYFFACRTLLVPISRIGIPFLVVTAMGIILLQHCLHNQSMAIAVPFLTVLVLVAVGATAIAVHLCTELSKAKVFSLGYASLYVCVRRVIFSILNIVLVVLLAQALGLAPTLFLPLGLSPVLYMMWAHCRASTRTLLESLHED